MVTSAVQVGAGQRGYYVFGAYAADHPTQLEFAAVVDPDPIRRERFITAHPGARPFADVADWLAAGRIADVAVVANPDRDHHQAATGALEAGYDVLLEKPMAASLAECIDLVGTASRTGRTLAVAHVLRYTPFFATLHDVIGSGVLGDIVTVEHRENVSAFHMAHSFVRGNWARTAEATPMIVQKCSHDFDVLAWNLGSPVTKMASVGSLFEFRPERAPDGATDRCLDPCPVESCPYDARRYLNPDWQGWPVHVITDDLSPAGRTAALRDGPFGRCAYTAGSDVVDHQVVVMELESGASVNLTMHGHSGHESRTMRYDGTRATLRGRFGHNSSLELTQHDSGRVETIPIRPARGSHGGGDNGVIAEFLTAVTTGRPPLTGARQSIESHVLAFAAEQARTTGAVLDVAEYRAAAHRGR